MSGTPNWNPLASFHRRWIHPSRIRKLAAAFVPLLDHAGAHRLLDVGCGDGLLASAIKQHLPDLHVIGCEVQPMTKFRNEASCDAIPLVHFDGRSLPFTTGVFDAALLCDVLHHCEDKGVALLAEVARVSRLVVVKDHFEHNRLTRYLLQWMDWVGNHTREIFMPKSYFTPQNFQALAEMAGLQLLETQSVKLPPHPSLHFIAQLSPTQPS